MKLKKYIKTTNQLEQAQATFKRDILNILFPGEYHPDIDASIILTDNLLTITIFEDIKITEEMLTQLKTCLDARISFCHKDQKFRILATPLTPQPYATYKPQGCDEE